MTFFNLIDIMYIVHVYFLDFIKQLRVSIMLHRENESENLTTNKYYLTSQKNEAKI